MLTNVILKKFFKFKKKKISLQEKEKNFNT